MSVECEKVSISRGFRLERCKITTKKSLSRQNSQALTKKLSIVEQTALSNFYVFSNYYFSQSTQLNKTNILDCLIDFNVQVYRNLTIAQHSGWLLFFFILIMS